MPTILHASPAGPGERHDGDQCAATTGALPDHRKRLRSSEPDEEDATSEEAALLDSSNTSEQSTPQALVLPGNTTVTDEPTSCPSGADAEEVTLLLPTSFTTACGRPICIRETRRLSAESYALLRHCAMDVSSSTSSSCGFAWHPPRPLLQVIRSRSEGPPTPIIPRQMDSAAPAQMQRRSASCGPFTGFTTARGDMIFFRPAGKMPPESSDQPFCPSSQDASGRSQT